MQQGTHHISRRLLQCLPMLFLFGALMSAVSSRAANFSGNASLKLDDPNRALTSTNQIFTLTCWFKLVVPGDLAINDPDHFTILMDRTDGNTNANHSFLLQVNAKTGVLEFQSRGTSGARLDLPLKSGLYVNRWYHVAIVRAGSLFTAYLDGQRVAEKVVNIGDSAGSGFSIGGFSEETIARYFYGDVMEVSLYDSRLDPGDIQQLMFADQRNAQNLRAYYKLGFSDNPSDYYRNFASRVVAGTESLQKLGFGDVTFEEIDQRGEQSLFDSRVNGGRGAIAPLSGAFVWQQSILGRATPGIAFDLNLGYSSAIPKGSGTADVFEKRTVGSGWRHSFDTRIVRGGSDNLLELRLLTWSGALETWTRPTLFGEFKTQHGEYRGELRQLPNSDVEWTTPERMVFHYFDPYASGTNLNMAGRLLAVRDPHDNRMELQWDTSLGRITNVVDTAGGNYSFNYNNLNLLANVMFQDWQINFGYESNHFDSNLRLVSKSLTNTSGLYTSINTTWQFSYYTNDSQPLVQGLLKEIIDPRTNINVTVAYDKFRRKTSIADGLNRTTRFNYGSPDKRSITVTDPENHTSITTFDRKGRVIKETDPFGKPSLFAYDDAGNRIRSTDPLGNTTLFAYDERSNMTARTNALGEVTRWLFHTNFNLATAEINAEGWTSYFVIDDQTGKLLAHHDALGLMATNVYATNGLLLSATDGRSHSKVFTYDTNGFLISSRDQTGTNTTRFTYNNLGWKLTETNALNHGAVYGYDLNGNVVLTRDQLNRTFRSTYDPNNNLLTTVDALGGVTSSTYDVANQRISTTDRTGTNTTSFTYTPRAKLKRTTNPLNQTVENRYDAGNRLIEIEQVGVSGTRTRFEYDDNDNRTKVIDELGREWLTRYDRLNRVIAETDPKGNTKLTSYDRAGRIKEITSPRGHVTRHEYDGRGRLLRWIDALGQVWSYEYDGSGNITNIVDAREGNYVMEYGPRNERTLERNQDGKEWRYAYDQLQRLKAQTDPNGLVRTVNYDDGGRIDFVSFSTGRTDDYTYDPNNNLTLVSKSRPSQATTTDRFTYDVMDQLIGNTNTFGRSIGFHYDQLGRRRKLIYPDGKELTYGYDPRGRLTAQTDWNGRTMSYAYDDAGRLVSRTYPNGIVQTNDFDEAGRLICLSYSTNSASITNSVLLALTYAYDRNGNKVGSTEKGTYSWPVPTLKDETSAYTGSGRLTTRQITTLASNTTATVTYQYDSSGNMTNAVGNGQTWSLAYDEDNRTTSINWDCGMTGVCITNRYDAFGRRISVKRDATETRYVLDLAGDMERILCDTDAGNNITAWYVHGADLSYRVDATNGLVCYHADAMGNVIALTDGRMNTVAQYAHSPYGRTLGTTNIAQLASLDAQPYRFVGSQGVMEEVPGLFFMRARYYAADAGVFLSTDPVKNIGSGWQPHAYVYANNNPLSFSDPPGRIATHIAAFGAGAKAGSIGTLSGTIKWQFANEVVVNQFGIVSQDSFDYVKEGVGFAQLTFEIAASVSVAADPSFHGIAFVAGYWAGKLGTKSAISSVSSLGASSDDIGHTLPYETRGTDTSFYQGNDSAEFEGIHLSPRSDRANSHADQVNGNTQRASASEVDPLTARISSLRRSVGRKRSSVSRALARADAFYAQYAQARSEYNQLVGLYNNSDYFNYFLAAQEPRRTSEAAYSQYQYFQERAREYQRSYDKYRNRLAMTVR